MLIEPVPETMPKSVDAPVKKGQEICEARVLYAGEEIARIKLVASEDVSRNVLLFIGATIKKVASSTIFKIIASIVAILVVGYIALFIYETTSAARDASSSSSIPESRAMNILRKRAERRNNSGFAEL